MSSKTALIITPHPDDHVFAAGTLILLKRSGYTIHEIVATQGESGTWLTENEQLRTDFTKDDLIAERGAEIKKASAIIGISTTKCLGLPDGGVEYSRETVEALLTEIRELRPNVLIIMHPHDYHRDHRNIAEISLEALRRAQLSGKPELGGKPWRVPVVLMEEGFHFVEPHILVDISEVKKEKDAAILAYASQFDERERKAIESMDYFHAFGTRSKEIEAAEAFEVHPEFPLMGNGILFE